MTLATGARIWLVGNHNFPTLHLPPRRPRRPYAGVFSIGYWLEVDMNQKAIVRQRIEKIEGVSRTWFEWNLGDNPSTKTLVVEVTFDTDPNSVGFSQTTLDAIEHTAIEVLKAETTMTVSELRIVPYYRALPVR
jgi:hypothetical protein